MAETSKILINNATVADVNNEINYMYMFSCLFCSEFLDGLEPKEELLAAVYKDVCQEIERLRVKLQ